MATDLVKSLKYLEKGHKETTTKEREQALMTILKIMKMKMDLSAKIISGAFFASLNLISEKNIVESEMTLLLSFFETLF